MRLVTTSVLALGFAAEILSAQGRAVPDYARAESFRSRTDGRVVDAPEPANWIKQWDFSCTI